MAFPDSPPPYTLYHEGIVQDMGELFQRCLLVHREKYPESKLNFDKLNLTGRLTHSQNSPRSWSHGERHKGTLMEDGRPVAIKFYRLPQYNSFHEQRCISLIMQFFHELKQRSALDHPNIAELIGFSAIDGNLGLATAWFQHGNLRDYLVEHPNTSKPDIVLDIVEGVKYLHDQLLVHGQLKADNVLIDERGVARLSEFRLSKQMEDLCQVTEPTSIGVSMATVPWTAPELDLGSPQALSSDIYSCAGLFLEIYCPGKYPYHYLSNPQDVITTKYQTSIPQRRYYPELYAQHQLWELMTTCWSVDPQHRPNIGAILKRLTELFRLGPRVVGSVALRPPLSSESPLDVGRTAGRSLRVFSKFLTELEQYTTDLDLVEERLITYLRQKHASCSDAENMNEFLNLVFSNISDIGDTSRDLLGNIYLHQQDGLSTSQSISDALLKFSGELRVAYLGYMKSLPLARKTLSDPTQPVEELKKRLPMLEARPDSREMNVDQLVAIPEDHLKTISSLLESALHSPDLDADDEELIREAALNCRRLFNDAKLKEFQHSLDCLSVAGWTWIEAVTPGTVKQTSAGEVKRQCIMFEMISSQMEFVSDMQLVQKHFITPLRNTDPPIIPAERLDSFIGTAFFGWSELLDHHQRMLERLLEIQNSHHPFIRSIISPIAEASLAWFESYMSFALHRQAAIRCIDNEQKSNKEFDYFLEAFLHRPETQMRDLNSFLLLPAERLAKIPIILGAIENTTPLDHEDRERIGPLLKALGNLEKAIQESVLATDQRAMVARYGKNLVFLRGKAADIDLWGEDRQLLYTDRFLRQAGQAWHEIRVFLFDNYLLITIPEERDGTTRFLVKERPIPLALLTWTGFDDIVQLLPTSEFQVLERATSLDGSPLSHAKSTDPFPKPISASELLCPWFPCQIGSEFLLFSKSQTDRRRFKEKIEEATTQWSRNPSSKVFSVIGLKQRGGSISSLQDIANLRGQGRVNSQTGAILCSLPFLNAKGERMVALGGALGLWFGPRNPNGRGVVGAVRRVTFLKSVTQCAPIEQLGILLVLAEGSLFAYQMSELFRDGSPEGIDEPSSARRFQTINNSGSVRFFRTGLVDGQAILLYMVQHPKGGQSLFWSTGLEKNDGNHSKIVRTIGRLVSDNKPNWFKPFRELQISSECHDVTFVKQKIILACADKFVILDLFQLLQWVRSEVEEPTIPIFSSGFKESNLPINTQKRPLGVFRTGSDEYIFCYNAFGIYTDRKWRVRGSRVIEWEGKADRVAIHLPYILLFNQSFIEVRHASTGRLAQIIRGTGIRCLWNGESIQTSKGGRKCKVHFAMHAPMAPSLSVVGIEQQVHELELIVT